MFATDLRLPSASFASPRDGRTILLGKVNHDAIKITVATPDKTLEVMTIQTNKKPWHPSKNLTHRGWNMQRKGIV
jgi:hypothetical protein